MTNQAKTPSRKKILQYVETCDIEAMLSLNAAVEDEHIYFLKNFLESTGILSPDMPFAKRIRLYLESLLAQEVTICLSERLLKDKLIFRWGLNAASSVVEIAYIEDENNLKEDLDYKYANVGIAFGHIGYELATEVIEEYLIPAQENLKRIKAYSQEKQDKSAYHTLKRFFESFPNQDDFQPLLSEAELRRSIILNWLEDILTLTGSYGVREKNARFRTSYQHDDVHAIPNDIDTIDIPVTLEARLSMSAGFGTALKLTGYLAEIFLEGIMNYKIELNEVIIAEDIFDHFSRILVKLSALHVDGMVSFMKEFTYYKSDDPNETMPRLKSITRMGEMLNEYNLINTFQNDHKLTNMSEDLMQHIHEKTLRQVDASGSFTNARSTIARSTKGDINIIRASLDILEGFIDYTNQIYTVFNKHLVEVTKLNFTSSELCPQLQAVIDDENGMQYYFQLVKPAIQRLMTFIKLQREAQKIRPHL